nr:hypothetical protein [Gammaproteobacteria bacterium]NIR98047.1 hypothetical protein [Gammaproteobacteria bacterium]NIT63757.1 hypothetical protein [Gammaproteobacteria bacterium]NIV20707.1 hypothetical protein [Gammaproteobacteria bacterium]NIY32337.1 hypothetical protein [Gammaproteobacteria bacterium]
RDPLTGSSTLTASAASLQYQPDGRTGSGAVTTFTYDLAAEQRIVRVNPQGRGRVSTP